MRQHSGSASTVLSLALGATHQTGLISLRRPRGIVGPVVAVEAALLSLLLLLLLMPIPRTAAGSAASASSGLVALILRVGPGGIVGMQVVGHASIDGTTLSIYCSRGLPLRCLDFVLQSINLFFCFLSLFVRCAGVQLTPTQKHTRCAAIPSRPARGVYIANRRSLLPLSRECFTWTQRPHTSDRTSLLAQRQRSRGATCLQKKTQSMGPLPATRIDSSTRLDAISQEIDRHRAKRDAENVRRENLRNYRRYYRFNSSFYD